jgi:hypothetical protein
MLLATGTLFTAGVVLFLVDFFFIGPKQGMQSEAALRSTAA